MNPSVTPLLITATIILYILKRRKLKEYDRLVTERSVPVTVPAPTPPPIVTPPLPAVILYPSLYTMIPMKVILSNQSTDATTYSGGDMLNSIIFMARVTGRNDIVFPTDAAVVNAAKAVNTLGFNLLNSNYSLIIVTNLLLGASYFQSNGTTPKSIGGATNIGSRAAISINVVLTNITVGSEVVQYNRIEQFGFNAL